MSLTDHLVYMSSMPAGLSELTIRCCVRKGTYNLGLSTFIVANGHPTGLPLDEVTIADSLAELGCAWARPLSAPAPASASS